ncbi:MAG: hypothetical protein AB8A43_01495, partial [Prochlorococcus sp.]
MQKPSKNNQYLHLCNKFSQHLTKASRKHHGKQRLWIYGDSLWRMGNKKLTGILRRGFPLANNTYGSFLFTNFHISAIISIKKVPLIEWREGLYNEYPIHQSHNA